MRILKNIFATLVLMIILGGCSGSRLSIQNGTRIVFFGDSITELGVKPNGYVTIVREKLTSLHPGFGIVTFQSRPDR
jgi:hypothetical protein